MVEPPRSRTERVQLFILSRDRLALCRRTVQSALAQTYSECEVVVSDNSEGPEVAHMLRQEFPNVRVIRRNPPLPSLSHFNRLIEEATAPLLVLFHDDDVLQPDYVACMVALFEQHPEVGAIGCNARILRGNTQTGIPFMGDFRGTAVLRKASELLEPYLSISLISPAPFPGYMYRTAMIQGLGLEADHGGKHADVSFLGKVLSRGPILWTGDCLFNYRFHQHNDSGKESVADRLSWLRYIYAVNGVHPKSHEVRDYKFMYWVKWLKQDSTPWRTILNVRQRRRVARKFVLNWALRMASTRIDFWKRAWRVLRRQ
jgi:cellulose synthase/poly-beta-1,6-N-acetylglucosamine synthase-like glycosyltransferase